MKSNVSLYLLYCTEECNELQRPKASLHLGDTASFEEMSQRWRAVGNTVSYLTDPSLEPQSYRSRDERVTARSAARPRRFQSCINYSFIAPKSLKHKASTYIKPDILLISSPNSVRLTTLSLTSTLVARLDDFSRPCRTYFMRY